MNESPKPYAPINCGQTAIDLQFSEPDDEFEFWSADDQDDLANEYAEEMRLDNRDRAKDQNSTK